MTTTEINDRFTEEYQESLDHQEGILLFLVIRITALEIRVKKSIRERLQRQLYAAGFTDEEVLGRINYRLPLSDPRTVQAQTLLAGFTRDRKKLVVDVKTAEQLAADDRSRFKQKADRKQRERVEMQQWRAHDNQQRLAQEQRLEEELQDMKDGL